MACAVKYAMGKCIPRNRRPFWGWLESMMMKIQKYPRTPHVQGSRLQAGDHDLSQVPREQLNDRYLVVEEKLDGANAGLSFDEDGGLLLQSRGHFLTGGPREKHFDLFKTWANCHQASLRWILGSRYQMYGEWLYAKHTVFYDRLPHYFLEFDIYDREAQCWLDTTRRHALLDGSPVVSVPVLARGLGREVSPVEQWLAPSLCQSECWENTLTNLAREQRLDPERVLAETFDHRIMEGVYIKVEEDGRTVDRLKWVHHGFLNSILDSGTHWLNRPIIANQLAEDVNIYG